MMTNRKSKCPMPMNCSYPACFLFFNHLHLHFLFFVFFCHHHIDDNKKRKDEEEEKLNEHHYHEQLLISIAISCYMCISHNTLQISNFVSFPLEKEKKNSSCLSRCTSSFMSLLIK